MITTACYVALSLSVLVICLSIVMCAISHAAELKGKAGGGRRVLTHFQIFVMCFFVAEVIALYPVFYYGELSGDYIFARIVKSVLLSAQNALQMFTLNAGFDGITAFFAGFEPSALGSAYSTYLSVMVIGAPMLTAGFVLSFFRDASALIKYALRPCKELYVFSELNACSLALARDIVKNGRSGKMLVFTDVVERGDEENDLILQARSLGALCVKKDVTELGLRSARRSKLRKLYFIGADEDESISQALTLIDRLRGSKYDSLFTQLYVFSTTAESEALLNSADHGAMKVRRINETRNFALLELKDRPIFEKAIDKGGVKRINLAIIGVGGYGFELLKAACWCGQMPGYSLDVHVFDKDDGEQKLKRFAPEIIKYNKKHKKGEAQYSIYFHNNVNVKTAEFLDEIAQIKDITCVYVSLGDDELNIETAINVRTALGRTYESSALPNIRTIVYSASKTATVSCQNGLRNMNGQEYGIEFIGSLGSMFCLKNIELTELEDKALELHLSWADTVPKKQEAINSFNQYEYHRRSSMARAVYMRLRESLGYFKAQGELTDKDKANNQTLRIYEHMRWNAYMRTEGYILGSKDHMAKTHNLLVPFDDLPDEEKLKDDF